MESEANDPVPIRISDRDRDAVINQLNDAVSDGRITMVEFEDRAKQTYAAQYSADLVPLTADLPATQAKEMTPVRERPEQALLAKSGQKKRRRWSVAIMSGTERKGNWDPADAVNSIAVMGGATLDLTEVVASDVTINALTVMGATEIIVPRGAVVDLGGFMVMGGTADETDGGGDSTMRVRVRSFGAMGACEVRHLNPDEEAARLSRGT